MYPRSPAIPSLLTGKHLSVGEMRPAQEIHVIERHVLEDATRGATEGDGIAGERGHMAQVALDPATKPTAEGPEHHTDEPGARIDQPQGDEWNDGRRQAKGAQLSHWHALH